MTSSRTSRVAFHVSDAAFGGLVSIPDPEPLAIAGFDSCFTAQDDGDRVQYIAGDGFWGFAGDADTEFGQGDHRLRFSESPGFVPAECTLLALTVLILALGPVSGAHFNPVVFTAGWVLG